VIGIDSYLIMMMTDEWWIWLQCFYCNFIFCFEFTTQ